MGTRVSRLTMIWFAMACVGFLTRSNVARAQTTSPALLVLEKADSTLAIIDAGTMKPGGMKIVARVPAGPDPHEIVTSPDGKLAYISNYGGLDSTLNTITCDRPRGAQGIGAHSARSAAFGAWAGVCGRQIVFHGGDE